MMHKFENAKQPRNLFLFKLGVTVLKNGFSIWPMKMEYHGVLHPWVSLRNWLHPGVRKSPAKAEVLFQGVRVCKSKPYLGVVPNYFGGCKVCRSVALYPRTRCSHPCCTPRGSVTPHEYDRFWPFYPRGVNDVPRGYERLCVGTGCVCSWWSVSYFNRGANWQKIFRKLLWQKNRHEAH